MSALWFCLGIALVLVLAYSVIHEVEKDELRNEEMMESARRASVEPSDLL